MIINLALTRHSYQWSPIALEQNEVTNGQTLGNGMERFGVNWPQFRLTYALQILPEVLRDAISNLGSNEQRGGHVVLIKGIIQVSLVMNTGEYIDVLAKVIQFLPLITWRVSQTNFWSLEINGECFTRLESPLVRTHLEPDGSSLLICVSWQLF